MKRHLLLALIPALLALQGCATSNAQRTEYRCTDRQQDERVRKLDDFDCAIEDRRQDKAPELDDLPSRH